MWRANAPAGKMVSQSWPPDDSLPASLDALMEHAWSTVGTTLESGSCWTGRGGAEPRLPDPWRRMMPSGACLAAMWSAATHETSAQSQAEATNE